MRPLPAVFVTAALMLNSGCVFKKQPKVLVPTAPAPVAATPAPTPAPPPVVETAPPPQTPAPEPARPVPVPVPTNPAPTPPRPRPAPAQNAPAPTPAPALGAILTTDQRRQLDAAYQADVQQTNNILNGLNGKTLTRDQNDTVGRARAFIAQAAQYHDRDLTTAAELARRARVLIQDLAGALRQ